MFFASFIGQNLIIALGLIGQATTLMAVKYLGIQYMGVSSAIIAITDGISIVNNITIREDPRSRKQGPIIDLVVVDYLSEGD